MNQMQDEMKELARGIHKCDVITPNFSKMIYDSQNIQAFPI